MIDTFHKLTNCIGQKLLIQMKTGNPELDNLVITLDHLEFDINSEKAARVKLFHKGVATVIFDSEIIDGSVKIFKIEKLG